MMARELTKLHQEFMLREPSRNCVDRFDDQRESLLVVVGPIESSWSDPIDADVRRPFRRILVDSDGFCRE